LGGVGGRKDRTAVAGIFRIFSLPSAERFRLSILNPPQPRTRRTTIRAKPRLTESIRTQPRLSEVKYFFCHPQFQPHPVACCHFFGKMAAHHVCILQSALYVQPFHLFPLKSFVLQGLSNFAGFCRFLHIRITCKKTSPSNLYFQVGLVWSRKSIKPI
jgi:hypothetical protein